MLTRAALRAEAIRLREHAARRGDVVTRRQGEERLVRLGEALIDQRPSTPTFRDSKMPC